MASRSRLRPVLLPLFLTVACLAPPGGMLAADGTLVGAVLYQGQLPEPETVRITAQTDTCGQQKSLQTIRVQDGRLEDAVVYLEHVDGATVTPGEALLDQRDCDYVPHVMAVPVGTVLKIRNSDAVLHGVHSYQQDSRTLFNFLQPPGQGGPVVNQKILREPGLLSIRCDAGHTWMSAYVMVRDNPYFTVTGVDGEFRLPEVPPGKYTLKVWHETLGELSQPVTVKAHKETRLEVTFKAPPPDARSGRPVASGVEGSASEGGAAARGAIAGGSSAAGADGRPAGSGGATEAQAAGGGERVNGEGAANGRKAADVEASSTPQPSAALAGDGEPDAHARTPAAPSASSPPAR